jgi:hypothetical protein
MADFREMTGCFECVSRPLDREKTMALHLPVQTGALGVCAAVAGCTVHVTKSTAHSKKEDQLQAGTEASPIYGITGWRR